jgi:hypothetical protein
MKRKTLACLEAPDTRCARCLGGLVLEVREML